MIRNVFLSLFLLLTLVPNAFSQNIFELKGRSIIIPPTTDQYENCVYTEQVLNKYKFKSEYLYTENILGDKIEVLDVRYINKGKKREAILLHAKHNGNDLVLHLPKHYKRYDNEILSACFYPTAEPNFWGNQLTTCLDSILLYHYDASLFDSICHKYRNKNVYYVGEQQYVVRAPYEWKKFTYQTPYKFKGISFDKETRYIRPGAYRYFVEIKVPCILLESGDKEFRVPIRMDSAEVGRNINFESSDITFQNFMEYFETEEEYMENSRMQYDIHLIRHLKKRFEGQEIYLKPCNYHIDKGYYLFKEIKLSRSYDGVYFQYFAFLEDPRNNCIYKYPIVADFEKDIVFADKQREIEQEEARKQAQEEAEYQAMLEKEEREYKANLIKKYGKRNALLILENAVQIGFTKEMCVEAWGEPYDINRTVTRSGIHEQWVYDIGRYLYFDGNILTAIQD